MTKDLSDFLKKPSKPIEEPQKTSSVSQLTEEPKKRIYTCANGKTITLDDLKPEDKQDYQKRFLPLGTGKGFKQRYKTKYTFHEKQYPDVYRKEPEYITKFKAYDPNAGLNERQIEYKKNVVNGATLREPLPKYIKSNNRQGLSRFIFINEIRACKNGFLYYTVPLLINFIFLIFNIFKYNFLANMLFSIVALIDFLIARSIIKSDHALFVKVLFFVLLIIGNVALVYLGSFIPGLYKLIYLPYTIKLFLIAAGIYYFGKFYVEFMICYTQDCNLDFGSTVQVNAGKPRSGKTSSGVHDAFILAKLKWNQLQYDYKIWQGKSDEIIKRGNPDELLQLEEIRLSYQFYIMRRCIPCLWSVIGISDKQGRMAHKLTIEHIKGLERLPLYSVLLIDEIGALLKPEDGLNKSGFEKPLDVSDMFRLGGHYVKWVVIGCEQDFNHIYIDCRRVVGFNKVIYGQEWVCRPTLLYGIFKFIKLCISESLDKGMKKQPKLAAFMYKFEKFVRSIGFRRIRYQYAGNTETGAKVQGSNEENKFESIGRVRTRWVPSTLVANYDDRAYKQKYPSYYDKTIKGELHTALHIDGADEKTDVFVNTTTALSEKRQAIQEEIKKIA
ncbi:MAG: hypothetical protein IKB30_02365 [Clostridia bacterium]|nr:hypothetical protein [Clostridia bacterium]